MKHSAKNTPSRDEINEAVNRFLQQGGQIKHQSTVKQAFVAQMLEEHGLNNESKSETDQDLMQSLTGILGVEEF